MAKEKTTVKPRSDWIPMPLLRERREALGLSRDQLSRMTDVALSVIYMLETGKVNFMKARVESVRGLLRPLDLTFDELCAAYDESERRKREEDKAREDGKRPDDMA